MEGTPERVEKYILATIALHNYLRQTTMLVLLGILIVGLY